MTDPAKPTPVPVWDDPTTRFARLITQIGERMNQRVAELFDESEGLRTVEVRILMSLAREQPRGVGHISRRTRIDKAWISRTLRRLESKGLVNIAEGDKAQSRLASLTPAGRACVARIAPRLLETWQKLSQDIDVHDGIAMLEIALRNMESSRPTG